jgi:two-component system sensor histidine kinase KdpD
VTAGGTPRRAGTGTTRRDAAAALRLTLAPARSHDVATALLPHFELANIVMLFLLTVVVVALKFGRGPAILAAFVSVAAFDFFCVPPRLSFAVSDVQYLLTFAVMLAVALIIGQMTAGLKYQARISSYREERARSLYEFARDLSSLLETQLVVEV